MIGLWVTGHFSSTLLKTYGLRVFFLFYNHQHEYPSFSSLYDKEKSNRDVVAAFLLTCSVSLLELGTVLTLCSKGHLPKPNVTFQ